MFSFRCRKDDVRYIGHTNTKLTSVYDVVLANWTSSSGCWKQTGRVRKQIHVYSTNHNLLFTKEFDVRWSRAAAPQDASRTKVSNVGRNNTNTLLILKNYTQKNQMTKIGPVLIKHMDSDSRCSWRRCCRDPASSRSTVRHPPVTRHSFISVERTGVLCKWWAFFMNHRCGGWIQPAVDVQSSGLMRNRASKGRKQKVT